MGSGLIRASFVDSVYDHGKVPSDRRPAVAFAGRSNVGKSSLINSLTTGKKIAHVSGTPGKTQSLNFYMAEDRFYLVDLPGYGYARVPKKVKQPWAQLVQGYLNEDPHLRGLVFLIDCRRELEDDDRMLLNWVGGRNLPFLVVMTKADKLSRSRLTSAVNEMRRRIFAGGDGPLVTFSTQNNMGRNEVLQWVRRLVA